MISLNLILNYFSFSQAIEEGFTISLYVFRILIKAVHSVSIIDSVRKGMEHKDIASFLHKEFQVTGWRSQMITVAYEKEKGLRENY